MARMSDRDWELEMEKIACILKHLAQSAEKPLYQTRTPAIIDELLERMERTSEISRQHLLEHEQKIAEHEQRLAEQIEKAIRLGLLPEGWGSEGKDG